LEDWKDGRQEAKRKGGSEEEGWKNLPTFHPSIKG
jgi:hypothetical protein